MEEKELIGFIRSVPGFCTEEDCSLLYRLAGELEVQGDILEIGAYKGRTTAVLAKGLIDSGKPGLVYSVDANLFGTKDELLSNLKASGVAERVVSIFQDSITANRDWARPLKFIWIDADGTYLSAFSDFLLWERFLVTGGIIAISCVSNRDIQRVIKQCLVDSGRFSQLSYTAKLCFAVKQKQGAGLSPARQCYVRFLYAFYLFAKKTLYSARKALPFLKGNDGRFKKGIKSIFDRFL